MSDARDQVARVIAESDRPADATAEEPLAPDLPPDRTRQFTHTSLSRVKTKWRDADEEAVAFLAAEADRVVREEMKVAFAVHEKVKRIVREPLADEETGEVLAYSDGTPRWAADELGIPVEDWSLLDDETRRNLMFTLVTHLFEWGLAATDEWAEAMYAKVNWEVAFARGYTSQPGHMPTGKPTIDDRTQHGHKSAADERYFAVFRSVVSRKADVVVRSMEALYRLLRDMDGK